MRSNPASATGDRYDRSRDLNVAIEKTGYYPTVVSSGVDAALAGEPVVSFLVHHEPTIDRDEVRRHMTVAVLTPSRLILAHTDENPPDNLLDRLVYRPACRTRRRLCRSRPYRPLCSSPKDRHSCL